MFPYSFFFKNIICILCKSEFTNFLSLLRNIQLETQQCNIFIIKFNFLVIFSFSRLYTQKYVIETSRREKTKKEKRNREEGAVWSPTITQLLPSFPSRDREKAGDNNFSRYLSKLLVPRRRARKEIPITFDTIESRVHTRAHTRVRPRELDPRGGGGGRREETGGGRLYPPPSRGNSRVWPPRATPKHACGTGGTHLCVPPRIDSILVL